MEPELGLSGCIGERGVLGGTRSERTLCTDKGTDSILESSRAGALAKGIPCRREILCEGKSIDAATSTVALC